MALIETIPVKEDYRRKLAQQLMREGMSADPVLHWAQGLGRLGQAALGGYQMYQADQRDKETEAAGYSGLAAALERYSGGVPSAPPAQPTPQRPTAMPPAPMTSVNPQAGAVPAALMGERPGGPVTPSAKVWGDKEAEAAGLYEPSTPTKTAALSPMVPTPVKTEAIQPTAAPAVPTPTAPEMDAAKAKLSQMVAILRDQNISPQEKRTTAKMAEMLAGKILAGGDKLEKLNDSTLFDPRTGRTIAIPGAEKPTVVGRDQRLVDRNGKIIVDQQPDKAVKITLSNGQEVTAIQNADGSFKIPEVAGAGSVTPKLSEGERDQIIKDEDTKAAGESALSAIKEARKLNDKAFSGAGAGVRSWVARNSPVDLGFIPGVGGGLSREGGKATTQLDNLLTEQALGSMKAIFGGNPTEGERKVLLDLQASSSKSPDERKEILGRAEILMNKRIQSSGARANSIRGGAYFKPGGGASAPASTLDALNQKYGLD